ncbi:MAG: ribulose-phosphate 3-epimerase [Bacteroidales bacterium]|nr:ribulose-phosphate 3-epimerase [Bacteroidales bacterium]
MTHLVAPSMLSADFTNLQAEIERINSSEADWFHMDVMDGIFVPNITFGMPVIAQMKKHAQKPFDVHLMIEHPDRYIADFAKAGADILSVQYEVCPHLHRTIQQIKAHDMKASVALNPHTPVSVLEDILPDLDMVLIMSVNPGFGGQNFIDNTYRKLKKIQEMKTRLHTQVMVEVDGGLTLNNASQLKAAGVDVLVAGSTVFKAQDPVQMISALKKYERGKNLVHSLAVIFRVIGAGKCCMQSLWQ